MNKEKLIKFLRNRNLWTNKLTSAEELADEILALDKKEEFPKYVKCIKDYKSNSNLTVGKIFEFTSDSNHPEKPAIYGIFYGFGKWADNFCKEYFIESSKEEFDKQQLQKQIANLKHGEWYIFNFNAATASYLIKFKELKDNTVLYAFKHKRLENEYKNCTEISLISYVTDIKSITPATKEEVEKYFPNEFKVKLDYKILSFKQDSDITDLWTYFENQGWARNNKGTMETKPYRMLENILNNHLMGGIKYNINSVKRLSDDEVFSIGDYFSYTPTGSKHKITNITNGNNEGLIIHGENNCSAIENYGFNKIYKAKQPILVTEDGKELFKGDKFWFTDLNNIGEGKIYDNDFRQNLKYFSNLEAAENFILENKPCLSIKDVQTIYVSAKGNYSKNNNGINYLNQLQELVKSKLK